MLYPLYSVLYMVYVISQYVVLNAQEDKEAWLSIIHQMVWHIYLSICCMILKSFVLIEKDGLYLLIKEAAKKWNGKWFLPGGKVEINETPEEAAYREVKEEAGCEICIDGMFYFKYNESFLDNYLAIFYTASIIGNDIKKHADKHSLEARWFTYDEIKVLPVRQKLVEILSNYDKIRTLPIANFKIS